MKILFPAVRVSDLKTSLAFYEAIGMEAVGRVDHAGTRMMMLALSGEEEVILELVERSDAGPVSAGGLDDKVLHSRALVAGGADAAA